MKKTAALLAILLATLLLAGCTGGSRGQQTTASPDITGTLIGWYDDTFEIQKADGTIVTVRNDFATEGMPIYEVKGASSLVPYTGEKRNMIGRTVYLTTKSESGGRTRVEQFAARSP